MAQKINCEAFLHPGLHLLAHLALSLEPNVLSLIQEHLRMPSSTCPVAQTWSCTPEFKDIV